MYKRITLLLTISKGVFTKTRSFNSEHLYTTPHIDYSAFDEVIIVCTDHQPDLAYQAFIDSMVTTLTIPLAMSGNISSLEDANALFNRGADRIIINRALWNKPNIIKEISDRYGKQAIIASIDYKYNNDTLLSYDWDKLELRNKFIPDYIEDVLPYIGEIIIQDVDQDGRVLGANIEAIKSACNFFPSSMPIHVGSCGIVNWGQYSQILKMDSVDAVSVINVHHMSSTAVRSLRKHCIMKEIYIRN